MTDFSCLRENHDIIRKETERLIEKFNYNRLNRILLFRSMAGINLEIIGTYLYTSIYKDASNIFFSIC